MILMRNKTIVATLVALTLGGAIASAEISESANWANEVSNHSANIQNYGGELLGPTTEWWLTGPADCDVNENGYAWDPEDQDTVGGWRGGMPNETMTMFWETAIPDLPGDDLTVYLYSGPGAGADVFASVDGSLFELIGTIAGGTEGYLREEVFDFAGVFMDDVQYIKVARTASGPQTGMFFDAFAGNVPEPGSLLLLVLGTVAVRRRRR
ncbi:MAG TPA: PEP-CTERM sorting domain-containing protein [Phycisphaerae bacterium]|nr:PEP-CTERM sorting domain-containing protein [Phycisphaerae bacterium]HNU46664.1 PEP-CTERM sorting domain-containing protein [Phycisphaerae bacterium]